MSSIRGRSPAETNVAIASDLALSHPATFIGRVRQLTEAADWLKAARDGRPSVVLVEGDLGIGKTRFAREVVRQAEELGMQVCFGRCDEYPTRPLPAFTGSLLPRLMETGALEDRGVSEYGAEVIRRLAGVSSSLPDGTSDTGGTLLQALPAATLALARMQPLLVVVDDLHWADGETLSVLQHLALSLADFSHEARPLCLVALHRPVSQNEPVARALERLRREPFVHRLKLGGLDELELNELIRGASATRCSPGLLAALQRSGHGNPLFVLAALDSLLERGALRSVDGQLESGVEPGELALPTEATRAIEERVGQASPELRSRLAFVSLLGDVFSAREVAIAAGESESSIEDTLEEAVQRRFIAETPDGFQFAHPTYRRALRETLTAARRRRIHAEIAARLIDAYAEDDGKVLEVAYHLVAAANAVDEGVMAMWCLRAARAAFAANAWSESATYYDAALSANTWVAGVAPEDRALIERDCGLAKGMNADSAGARGHFLTATTIARSCGNLELWGEALVGWAKSYTTVGARLPDTTELESYVTLAGDASPNVRARLLAVWAEALWLRNDPDDLRVAERAQAVAREGSDGVAMVNAAIAVGICRLRRVDLAGALEAFETASSEATGVRYPSVRAAGPARAAATHLLLGHLAESEAAASFTDGLARAASDWVQLTSSLATASACLALRGDLEAAERAAVEGTLCLSRSAYRPLSGPLFATLAWLRFLGGKPDVARDALTLWSSWAPRSAATWVAAFLDAAQVARPQFPEGIPAPWRGGTDLARLGSSALVAHVARLCGSTLPADFPSEALASAHAAGARFTQSPPLSILRALGVARGVDGDLAEAATLLAAAIAECDACGAVSEATLARLDLAWIQLRRGEFPAAAHEAVAAIEEHGLWGLRALLEKTLAGHGLSLSLALAGAALPDGLRIDELHVLRSLARGRGPEEIAYELALSEPTVAALLNSGMARAHVASPAEAAKYLENWGIEFDDEPGLEVPEPPGVMVRRSFLFTDIAGSTPLNELLGDEQYFRLLQRHNAVVETLIRKHAGVVMKNTGDGYFATFEEPARALACATDIVQRFPLSLPGAPTATMHVGVGVHDGAAVLSGNDAFGIAVVTASRICGLAAGGEILVTEAIRRLAPETEGLFADRGRPPLKGIARAPRVYQMRPRRAPVG